MALGAPEPEGAEKGVRELADRIRLGLWLALAAGLAVLGVQAFVSTPLPGALPLGALQIGTVIAGLVLMRGDPTGSRPRWVGGAALLVSVAAWSLPGVGAGHTRGQPALVAMVAIAAGAFIPWGTPTQVAIALALGSGLLGAATFMPGDASALGLGAALLGLGVSVALARQALRRSAVGTESGAAEIPPIFDPDDRVADVLWLTGERPLDVVYFSPAVERLSGRSRDWLREDPRRWLGLLHPEDRARIRALSRDTFWQEPFDVLGRLLRSDGAIRTTRTIGLPIADEGGRTWRYVGICRDVTDAAPERGLFAGPPDAAVAERQRLAKELHRGLAQSMATLGLSVSWLRQRMPADRELLGERIAELDDMTAKVMRSLRRTMDRLVAEPTPQLSEQADSIELAPEPDDQ